jgi:hypothetical protein
MTLQQHPASDGKGGRRFPAAGPALYAAVLACFLSALWIAFPAPWGVRPATDANPPFQPGERLLFRVDWNPPWYLFFLPAMEAGRAELVLGSETQYENKEALKIVFKAVSSGTLVKLTGMKIDDYYEFYTDPETLCTFAAIKREREGKRRRNIEIAYLPESRRLHIKEVDLATNPPTIRKDAFIDDIPPCVKDVFSTLYSIRMKPLAQGASERSLVGDNDRVKEVETRVERRETVDTPRGRFDAWRLETVALMGGLFRSGGQFKIWLTADQRRLPVQFEVKVNLGKVTGKLLDFSTTSDTGENRSRP